MQAATQIFPPENGPPKAFQLIQNLDELLDLVELTPSQLPKLDWLSPFPLRLTHHFASKINKADPVDPLLLQVLPLHTERSLNQGYAYDALDEISHTPTPGLIHKYFSRVLLTTTGACSVHCRYCFRRHFDYTANSLLPNLPQIRNYISSRPDVHEVILSGGDPLMLPDSALFRILNELSSIEHVTTLRVHTRVPTFHPQRLSSPWFQAVLDAGLKLVLVLHCNHANEINTIDVEALSRLSQSGVILLNQSVLLKGVNDSVEALANLSHALFSASVLPYYLHQLDPVHGSAHFYVSEREAKRIHTDLLAVLPGYLVPKYVKEEPGQLSKTPVC